MGWSDYMCTNVWTQMPENRIKWRNNRNWSSLNHQTVSVNMWWSDTLSFNVWMQFPVKELNQETTGTFEHHFIQPSTVNMWWSGYFSVNKRTHLPVNRIKWRNKWNSWVHHPSSEACQYVVVSFFLFQYVDTFACEQILMKKQLELLSIWSIKWGRSVCGNLVHSLSMCGCGCLWTEVNEETIATLEHLVYQRRAISPW